MEKKGNIDAYSNSSPPPPYGYPQGNMAPAGVPPGSEYDPNCQKVPLYPSQNPGGPAYPVVVPQGQYYAQQPMGYAQQPQGYGQQPQAVVFVQPTALTNPPQDHLGYSIFVTVCCCWIIGLFAIIKSAECRSAIAAGDRSTADIKSRQAKKLGNVALGLGLVSLVVTIVLFGVYYGMILSQMQHY